MTDTRRLRELASEATPGPWATGDTPGDRDAVRSVEATGYDREEGVQSFLVAWCHGDLRAEADAAVIVAAVNALPALLDVADAARALGVHDVAWRPGTSESVLLSGDALLALRAALDRLDSHEKADPLHREAGRGVGRDGDTEVETIRWDDGSYTVADVRRSGSHEKADARDDPEFGHLVDSDVQP